MHFEGALLIVDVQNYMKPFALFMLLVVLTLLFVESGLTDCFLFNKIKNSVAKASPVEVFSDDLLRYNIFSDCPS